MSYWEGKDEVCAWVRRNFDLDSTILDVGAYDGNWHYLLPEYKNIDAVVDAKKHNNKSNPPKNNVPENITKNT